MKRPVACCGEETDSQCIFDKIEDQEGMGLTRRS